MNVRKSQLRVFSPKPQSSPVNKLVFSDTMSQYPSLVFLITVFVECLLCACHSAIVTSSFALLRECLESDRWKPRVPHLKYLQNLLWA